VESNDQLASILAVVQDGHECYRESPCYDYMSKMSQLHAEFIPLNVKFQDLHPNIVSVLENMLNLDPK
jgi:hypothetical protein